MLLIQAFIAIFIAVVVVIGIGIEAAHHFQWGEDIDE